MTRRPFFGLLYQPRMIDDECEAVGGMRIGRENRSTRRKPVTAPLCRPQIQHVLTWDRIRVAVAEIRRLTARDMAQPSPIIVTDLMECQRSNMKTLHLFVP
jgi:hypothetical protein